MEQTSPSENKERAIAGLLVVLGAFSLVGSLAGTRVNEITPAHLLLAALLAGAIVLADHFPIHITRGTKASLVNLPIFLAAVLLPAAPAVLVAGVGLLLADILTLVERGLLPRDIAATAGQWMFTAYVGYQIVNCALPGIPANASRLGLLLFCAFSFLLVDFMLFSLSQSFIFAEPFLSTLKSVVREGIVLEGIQYLIAVLGAIAASQDIWALVLLAVPLSLTYVAFKNIKEVRRETFQMLEDMADTVDLRDVYTGGHSKRVAGLVSQLLVQLKISGPEATLIEIAARLHDIGKIGIPDAILMKPGRLAFEEMAVMQTHAEKGAELISKYKDFARGAMMIRHHHERWDGGGYPVGLRAHEIPFGARVIAVADSFDAMTSDRPYRAALSSQQAIQTLLEGRGGQWDANIVNAFVDMQSERLEERPGVSVPEQLFSHEILQTSPISSR